MWIFNLKLSFVHIVIFSSMIFSNIESYPINEPVQSSPNENVLADTFPPRVTKELPLSVTFYASETLRLRCNIEGKPRPTYQWYKSKNDLTENQLTVKDQKFEPIPSENDETLAINELSTKKIYSKYIYYCSAQNPLGVMHTNKIIVEKMTRPPTISIKHTPHPVFEGEKYVVQCNLVPDLVPLFKFKCWEIRIKQRPSICINQTEGRFSVISSTKFPQLHIRNVSSEDFGQTKVRCMYRSSINNHDDMVQSSFIFVEKYSYDFYLVAASVECPGETVTAAVGTSIELPWCTVPKTLNVTWFKIDNLDPKKKIEISNKVGDSKFVMISRRYGNLLIRNVTKDDAGIYMAESTIERRSSTFTLMVYEKPTINLSPRDIRKKVSESAEFNCVATFSKSQFRWLYNGLIIISGYDDGNIEIVSTHNTSRLLVKSARLSVSGVFQCIATSMDEMKRLTDYRQISGTLLLSEVAPILVKQSPRVEKDSSTAQMQMSLKRDFKTIECIFAANPRPHINWYHNSKTIEINSAINIIIEQDPNSIYNSIVKMTITIDENERPESNLKYAGEYKAVATNSIGTASCNTFILMDGNLEIRLPREQKAIGGVDYLLTCFFIAVDVPEFFWDRKVDKTDVWETLPVNHRTNLVEKGYKLLLKNVIKVEDEGTYRCTVKYNKETKSAETRLIVVYPPYLQNLPTKHDSSQSQTHICSIRSAADKPWYTWWTFTKYNSNETIVISPNINNRWFNVYYDQVPVDSRSSDDRSIPSFVLKYPNVGVDLNVKARSNDERFFGKFVCHAKNHIGSDKKSIEDYFLRLEFQNAPPSLSEVVVGDDLFLDCTAKESDLKPVVKWRILKGDTKYVDINNFTKEHNGRIFQYNNGTLVMRSIKETDPSRLYCFIFPTGKSDKVQSKISYIDIRVPARIVSFKKEIFKESGSSFNLSCNVYGHVPDMKIIWYYKSSDTSPWDRLHEACINSNENPCISQYQINPGRFKPIIQVHNRTYHSVHLEFQESTETISGQYRCEAKNKFNIDSDRSSTKLVIISKPSMVPIDPIQKESTSTSVGLEWKPPDKDGNRPILRYLIKYYEISNQSNGDQKNVTQKSIQVNDTVRSITIDQLRPNKKYAVEISAQNEVGVSESATIYLMTQEAKPQRSVNDLKASSTKPDEILISWSDPDSEYQNGYISRYQMCYQIIPTAGESKIALERLNWPDISSDLNQFPNVLCQEINKRAIIVPNLPQFTDFGIRLIAFNSKGASPAAFTKVRTLEDLPQSPPSAVTCEGQHQAIELTWNPPGRQTINGVLIGYAVHYYQPNKYRDESGMKSVNVQGRTNVVIDQLKPFTPYSIQVMAINRKGLGPPSVSVICETKEAKPEPPEMVKAVKINNTCLAVSWLHTKNPNGIIQQYCVVSIEATTRSPKCQPPDLNKRYNMMILCDIYGRFSSLQVYAKNQYEGASRETSKIDDIHGIVSIGGEINVKQGSTVTLPCETVSTSYKSIYWKKDGRDIVGSEYPNMKILQNFSLQISSVDQSSEGYNRYGTYQCSTESDTIDYTLNIQELTDSSPRPPMIDETIITENSLFIRWKSRGTSDIAVPITGYEIKWDNLYTGDSKILNVDGNIRSFYLNNVTCASDFLIQVNSVSGNGKSKFSDSRRIRTQGTVPEIADSTILLPHKNIEAQSANFNMLAFGPGNNCSAMYFTIEISLTSSGSRDFTELIVNKNISVYDLENKCCYKVTGLNPRTQYQYRITAFNPAGPTSSYNILETPAIYPGQPGYRQNGASTSSFANQSWLLMIILVIVIIFVLIIVIVGVLYILRSKEKKSQSTTNKAPVRRSDFNQNRIEQPLNQEDNASIDSEPSPYAVYQPEADQKMGAPIWPQQVSQQSTTPQYNYPDHSYYQIRYDRIAGRPNNLDNHHDNYRRANSAECLSSLGNASVTGIADLESPSNIDPNVTQDYFRAPFTQCPDNDEVFQNIRYPDFSTVNRKRIRRESENLHRYNGEESGRFLQNGAQQVAMSRSRYYEPSTSQLHQQQQQRQLYQAPGTTNHRNYRQQISVPEPVSMYHQQYGFPSNRIRTSSGTGRNHPSSQTVLPNNSGSSAQVSGYGSYYGSRNNNIQPYSTSSAVRRDNEQQNNQYSAYKAGSSNYNHVPRTSVARPAALERIESPDEGIYTDRVIVV